MDVAKNVYRDLENKIEVIESPKYKELVNFSRNLCIPIHRWFDIKEGYSRDLIVNLVDRFGVRKGDFIMDPFAGSGTTLLAAKEKGINSLGFEINPFLAFLSKVKLTEFTIEEIGHLKKDLQKIARLDFKPSLTPPKLSISKKLFGERLEKLLMLKEYILSIPEPKKRDFFFLTFLSILEATSIAKKDGNGLKYPKNKVPAEVMPTFVKKAEEMLVDIETYKLKRAKTHLFQEDVRNLYDVLSGNYFLDRKDIIHNLSIREVPNFRNKISLVVFSPPYMNCFDYTEVYKMELWFGDFVTTYPELKRLREQTLVSHLNTTLAKRRLLRDKYVSTFVEMVSKKKLWNKKIPLMIEGYFEDMWKVLKGIYELLKKNHHCIIVVGNSAYGNIAIPTDLLLGNIGLEIGFEECKIEVARHLGTSSQQYKKINNKSMLRESLVVLKK